MVKVYAVIPTRDRHIELTQLIDDIGGEAETIVIDNKSDPPIDAAITYDVDPPNISRMWNMGLEEAFRRAHGEPHDVAILNNDLRLGVGTLTQLSQAIRTSTAAASFPDMHGRLTPGHTVLRTSPGPYDLYERMSGYCFMLRGELTIRADESMCWWYSDDDIEWRASAMGGVVRIGGLDVRHLYPDESTNARADLGVQAGRDRERFIAKWGRAPW